MGQRYGEAVTEIKASVEVDGPPEKVWEVVSNPRNLPQWDRHITKVVGVPPEGLDVGVEYTTRLTFWGVSAHVDADVLEFEPPGSSKIRLSGPLIRATVTTRLTPLGEDRCRLEHTVEYELRGGPF